MYITTRMQTNNPLNWQKKLGKLGTEFLPTLKGETKNTKKRNRSDPMQIGPKINKKKGGEIEEKGVFANNRQDRIQPKFHEISRVKNLTREGFHVKLKNSMQTRAGAFNSVTGKAKKVGCSREWTVTNECALALASFGWRNSRWQPYAPMWRVKLTLGDWIGGGVVVVVVVPCTFPNVIIY